MSDAAKEPGQVAFEAVGSPELWACVPDSMKASWARVEAAVLEESARAVEGTMMTGDDAVADDWNEPLKYVSTAIRAMTGSSNG
jgi:myo-inositol catabolism protein IolC